MANPKHIEIVRAGTREVRAWRERHPEVNLDLAGATLAGLPLEGAKLMRCNLTGADLQNCKLVNADLTGADLSRARLGGSNLIGANLTGATLVSTDLSSTTLKRTSFVGADLTLTNLAGATVEAADFEGAIFGWTKLQGVSLSTAANLSKVIHVAPSTGDVSRWASGVPTEFVDGAGYRSDLLSVIVPPEPGGYAGAYSGQVIPVDDLMTFLTGDATYADRQKRQRENHDALLDGVRRASCFISYSQRDSHFAESLRKELNARGIDYWYAPDHAHWGAELTVELRDAISSRDRILLLCSSESLNESSWVSWEIDIGLKQEEVRQTRVIFPVMIDDSLLSWDDPRGDRLRQVIAADFRDARSPDAFGKSVEQLIEGLASSDARRVDDGQRLRLARAYVANGISLRELGQYRDAVTCYNEALHLDSGDTIALCEKGLALGRIGDLSGAISCYDDVLRIEPESAIALNNKADCLRVQGDYDAARQLCKRSIRSDPEYEVAWFTRAEIEEDAEAHDEALKAWQDYLDREFADAPAFELQAECRKRSILDRFDECLPNEEFAILLLNNDSTSLEFVVDAVEGTLGLSREAAATAARDADRVGASMVGIHERDMAMEKAKALNQVARQAKDPLRAVIVARSSLESLPQLSE